MLREKCVEGIEANEERCRANVEGSTALVTSLVPALGYEKSSEIAYRAKAENKTVREIVLIEKLMDEATFNKLIEPRIDLH
jgi:aspartate ammonia-lyase